MKTLDKVDLFRLIDKYNMIDEMGTQFIVVDEELHIHFINYNHVDEKQHVCPGDLLKCQNALATENGCGCHENCKHCNLRNMVETSMHDHRRMESNVSLLLKGNTEFDLHAVSTPITYNGKDYSVVFLNDNTSHQRELMVERVFFHDLLNLSGALNGFLDCADSMDRSEMLGIVKGISEQLVEEICAQRDIIYALNGILEPTKSLFKAQEVTTFVQKNLTPMMKDSFAVNLETESSLVDEELNSDKALVNRVLHNMIKNACEATGAGKTVKVKARATDDKVIFSVHNDNVMPPDVKSKIFIYGNSTKGRGRGLGTYSMKLIGENYLGGTVRFRSEEGSGTEFYLELAKA